MSAISLQDISKSAHDYQSSKESDPDVLAGILTGFADQLSRFAEAASGNIKVKAESQARRIIEARDSTLYHRVGQLSFWAQMMEIEELARTHLSPAVPNDSFPSDPFIHLRLEKIYNDLVDALLRAGYLNCAPVNFDTQSVKIGQSVADYYVFYIESLIAHIPGDVKERFAQKWVDFKNAASTNRAKAMAVFNSLIDLLKDIKKPDLGDEKSSVESQVACLEQAIVALEANDLGPVLRTFKIEDLSTNDRVRLVKKAIEQPDTNRLVVVVEQSWFNQLPKEAYEELIAFAEKYGTKDHVLLIKASDGFVRKSSGTPKLDEPDDDEPLTKEQIASLELAAGSLETDELRALLVSLPVYDLTADDKVRIVKRAIDQPHLAPLAILLQHDCFNEMSKPTFDQLIAYAKTKAGSENHILLLQSSDGYMRANSSTLTSWCGDGPAGSAN